MNDILSFLSGIRWQDIIDVAVNSYILFRLYMLFRGTNAFRALLGIGVLLFLEKVAVYTGLIVTSWVAQGVTALGAFIIIIIFSNEIRTVFQMQNIKAILWGNPKKAVQTPVDIIVDSVFEMANKHCGALIVIPGKEDLKDVTQNGIPWNGKITREMILSIFFQDNPVHDGAAIIQGDHVSEVSVILPLSQRNDLPSYYGTRHRAAAGLAEVKDALVIVVSEERGKVAIAKGNKIEIVNRRIDLKDILNEHLGITTHQNSHQLKERLRTWAAACACVLLMIGIWYTATRGMDTLITVEVPVEYVNLDPNMEIVETSADTVRLHLNGSLILVKSIRPEQVRLRLNMSRANVGENTFNLTKDDISIPPGVSLRKITPHLVKVTLDVPVQREFPIQVNWTGKLNEHLILTEAYVVPNKIKVVGGSLKLDNIHTIYTEKVPLDTIEKSGNLTVKLNLDSDQLRFPPNSTSKVTVTYVVKERSG